MRASVQRELDEARRRVDELECELSELSASASDAVYDDVVETKDSPSSNTTTQAQSSAQEWPLSLREYQRYGRQMVLSSVGLQGQLRLKKAKILVIGAGGLGCPVLQYLVAAGVGHVTIMDHDNVELSNLHRQVLHNEHRVGMSKAESARLSLQSINSDVRINAHVLPFTPALFHSDECPDLVKRANFDLVLDCTDNPATRHFLNAYAVAHDVPLVSGGAVRTEGTVGVFGLPIRDPDGSRTDTGPCYACIFPPPPLSTAQDTQQAASLTQQEKELREDQMLERQTLQGTGTCSDEGVLGILCGVVGVQMAAEAVRVLLGTAKPTLHLLSPTSASPLRTIKVRARKPDCPSCGHLTVDLDTVGTTSRSTPISRWQQFVQDENGAWPGWQDLCAVPGVGHSGVRNSDVRSTSREVQTLSLNQESSGLIVDVRPPAEYSICHLPNSVNIPFAKLLKQPRLVDDELENRGASTSPLGVTFVCRRGNDSLLAARAYRRFRATVPSKSDDADAANTSIDVNVSDMAGGLVAWSRQVDRNFPIY
ncbi:hypothetical protein ACM66B_007083 [Microbotryomycetes sp. NB124-2]